MLYVEIILIISFFENFLRYFETDLLSLIIILSPNPASSLIILRKIQLMQLHLLVAISVIFELFKLLFYIYIQMFLEQSEISCLAVFLCD